MFLYLILVLASIFATSHAGVTTLDDDVVSRMHNAYRAPDLFFPYQARLLINNNFFCGAVIIHERYVITAAHCLQDRQEKLEHVTVVVGTNDFNYKKGISYKAEKFIIHENFTQDMNKMLMDRRKMHNDIGLVRVSKDMEFDMRVSSIALAPSDYKYKVGDTLLMSGWGLKAVNSTFPKHLLMALGTIQDFEECSKIWEDRMPLDDAIICYKGETKQSSCKGDSGGPAVDPFKNVLVGIMFGSAKCGESKYPSILTEIPYYYDWIKRNMEK